MASTQKDFSRQIGAINFLSIGDDEPVIKFATEEWANGAVFVVRFTQPVGCKNFSFRETFSVGVRGNIKRINRSTIYGLAQ